MKGCYFYVHNKIFAVLKLSVSLIVTFVQETYQYKKDMELAEEFNILLIGRKIKNI